MAIPKFKSLKLIYITTILVLCLCPCKSKSEEWRTYTGENNNLLHPTWGVVDTPFIRLAKPDQFNAFGYPNITHRPTSREVSNMIFDQQSFINSTEHYSDMMNMWGQFVIHNMALSKVDGDRLWPIVVPTCDPYFDPYCNGNLTMAYYRTRIQEVYCDDPTTKNVRDENGKCYEQLNRLSAYMDANVLYGSSDNTCNCLRLHKGGEMKMSYNENGDLPPRDVPGIAMDNDAKLVAPTELFCVGEGRGNENTGLLTIHTVLLREHNRLARKFASSHPDWDEETLFQHTRSCIIEEIQHITYKEYLPALLGSFPEYTGYNPNVHIQVSNEFTTTAFRFGHSEVGPNIEYIAENGTRLKPLPIKSSYFNPKALDNGVDDILRGLILNEEQNIDIFMIGDLRNFLFGKPGQGGLDLASRNLNRNRDHGIPGYNSLRRQIGLRPVKVWSDISSNPVVQDRLKNAYRTVDDIDAYVGGLAEDHIEGAGVGQTFYVILSEQFLRTRTGDRFWYERPAMKLLNRECETSSFSEIIKRNTKIRNIPDNVFFIQQH